jgi:hypothetical protein
MSSPDISATFTNRGGGGSNAVDEFEDPNTNIAEEESRPLLPLNTSHVSDSQSGNECLTVVKSFASRLVCNYTFAIVSLWILNLLTFYLLSCVHIPQSL